MFYVPRVTDDFFAHLRRHLRARWGLSLRNVADLAGTPVQPVRLSNRPKIRRSFAQRRSAGVPRCAKNSDTRSSRSLHLQASRGRSVAMQYLGPACDIPAGQADGVGKGAKVPGCRKLLRVARAHRTRREISSGFAYRLALAYGG